MNHALFIGIIGSYLLASTVLNPFVFA